MELRFIFLTKAGDADGWGGGFGGFNSPPMKCRGWKKIARELCILGGEKIYQFVGDRLYIMMMTEAGCNATFSPGTTIRVVVFNVRLTPGVIFLPPLFLVLRNF